ncbi:MAG TPA: M6 family metalloprotease domain-containing protein [Gemmatimonadales bacterium]|nr:M6 family metalloprotease domain-containing protein [Gemmatimonadales bacterium]
MVLTRPLFLACAVSCVAAAAGAQARSATQQRAPRWEVPGLDISPNGGWRIRARAVAAARARLLAQRNFAMLNAAPAGAAAVNAVAGTLRVPVIMFRYQDSPSSQYARDTTQYNATLFATVPPAGKPYTLRSFYEQMSNGLFSIQGAAAGWEPLAGNESAYTGAAGTCPGNPYGTNNCNGLFSSSAFAAMQSGLREALAQADATIDFGQFDNDGPDGIPNSGDDDGVVDAVLFLHPSMDGACVSSTNNHLWSHRSSLTGTGTVYTTNDNRTGGGKIVVNDYILQSGLGSSNADGSPCGSDAIMPIGTAAHELGHILALPDLYDTQGITEGIGEYGLMSSGNYTTGNSPARYDAWSLQQMGWTTIAPLTTTGTYTVGPVPTADTVFYVNVQGANSRNEYFLIENRQEVESDSAMLRHHCDVSQDPPGCGGGLLIYHVDGQKACLINVCSNSVNAGAIHGVVVEEADGLRQLWNESAGGNRGDGGDPYPGTTGNPTFSFRTNPAATTNFDTSFVGFAVDSIRQLVPNGEMAFRLRFGGLTLVAANDTTAQVQVDGQPYNVFRDLLEQGSSHTVAVADTQLIHSGRTRLTFQSWSDGGAISHTITGAVSGATYTATLAREHRLDVTVGTNGTVAYSPAEDTSGTFILEGTPVTLTATPTAPMVFGGWTGDTTAVATTLVLPMGRPFAVSAQFDPQLLITSATPRPSGTMGALYADTLRASGGGATQSWQKVSGTLPPGLALSVTGRITGFPSQTGQFTFTVRVTSGAQSQQQTYAIGVTAPTLVAATVLAQLLNGTGALTTDQLRYIDMLGNNNCGIAPTPPCFDLGDFAAWVKATGATPVAPLAAARKGGRP